MESKDLRYFLEVAKTGSFSQAALNLYSVQSNVTTHIKKLENEINSSLFIRNKGSVTLTPDGQKLLVYAEKIIGLLDEAKNAMQNFNKTFTIGTTSSLSLLLPAYIKMCMNHDPSIKVSIKIFTNEELQQKRYTCNLDCIVTNNSTILPFNYKNTQFTEKLTVISPLHIETPLWDQTVMVSSNQTCIYRQLLCDYLKANSKSTNILEFDSLSGIKDSVELGLGISLVPSKSVESNNNVNKTTVDQLSENTLTVVKSSNDECIYYDLLLTYLQTLFNTN